MANISRFHIANSKTHNIWHELEARFFKLQFTRKQKLAFLEDLASLVEDGVPVNQTLETIRDVSHGVLRFVAADVVTLLAKGQLLADGLANWFPMQIVEVVRAGETSGTLSLALRRAAENYKQQSTLFSGLLTATLYPLAVVILALIVTVFVRNSVLINFAQIKPLAAWPDIGRHLFYLASFVQHAWWLVLVLLILMSVMLVTMLRQYTGHLRHAIDKTPLLCVYRQVIAARFMQTLGMLMQNGVVIKSALALLCQQASPYLAWHILLMEYRLSGGQDNIADVLDTGLVDQRDLVRLKVLSRTKGFEQALVSLGQQANARNAQTIAAAGRLLGGLLLALGAIIAATIIIGIYTVGSVLAV